MTMQNLSSLDSFSQNYLVCVGLRTRLDPNANEEAKENELIVRLWLPHVARLLVVRL